MEIDSNDDTAQDSAQLEIAHSNSNGLFEARKKTAMRCEVIGCGAHETSQIDTQTPLSA